MRFYKPHTRFYCGVDMHSRVIYICIIGEDKKILVHKKIRIILIKGERISISQLFIMS